MFDVSDKPVDMSNAVQNGKLELLRRKKWLDMIPADHCLRDLIESCLQDHSQKRPSTEQIKEKLQVLCLDEWRNGMVIMISISMKIIII